MNLQKDIGALTSVGSGFPPQTLTAAQTVNGTVIDRFANPDQPVSSIAVLLASGAITGTPSGDATLTVEHSDAAAGPFVTLPDVKGVSTGSVLAAAAAANANSPKLRADLDKAGRYIRVSVTSAFGGGNARVLSAPYVLSHNGATTEN